MLFRRKITIEVAGGLGNQLFCYFAGVAFANKLNADLNIDLLYTSTAHSSKFDLQSFKLPGNFIGGRSLGRKKIRLFARRVLDSLGYRSKTLRVIGNKIRKILFEVPGSEFDPGFIDRISIGQRIQGFFATSKYIRSLQERDLFRSLELAHPSSWFNEISIIAQKARPICVHIRRGDFLMAKDSYGVLSEEYFSTALDIADSINPGREVWVFSDDMKFVKTWKTFQGDRFVFIDEIENDFEVIKSGGGVDPAEFLKLMTFASVNIISNSSFSYFGAMLNPNNPVVIRPNPTAKSPKNRLISLYPDDWISCPAAWE